MPKAFARAPLAPLLALNAALVAALALVSFGAPADAQVDRRRAGTYLFLPFDLQHDIEQGLVVVDTVNREMSVVRWDPGRTALVRIGARSFDRDAMQRPQRSPVR